MLSLCFYYNSKSVNDLNFLENQELDTVIVAPSPQISDSIRSKVKNGAKVLTISKFISEYFEFFKVDLSEKFKNKSNLLKDLLMVWKIVNPDLGYEQFKRSFNLFTDLRSFSVNKETINSVLNEYDDISRQSVLAYYQFLESQGYVEEHSRYFILSELLREYDVDIIEKQRNIIIMGFTFMSASQVDLIKSLAILHNVYIPFPKEVFEEAIDSDWIKWVVENNTNIIQLDQEVESKEIQLYLHPKNGLSHALKTICSEDDFNEICLLTKNASTSELIAASIKDSYFKCSISLFENKITDIFDDLEDVYFRNSNAKVDGNKLIDSLKEKLNTTIKNKNLLMIKPITLSLNTIDFHINLNDRNQILQLIDLKVLRDVILLDAPRSSMAVLNANHQANKVLDLNQIDEIKGTGKVYVCMNSDLGSIASSEKNYTESVETILYEIGPIKRAMFDFNLIKHKIRELLSEENVRVICENKLLDTNLHLNSVFSDFEIHSNVVENEIHKKVVDDFKPKVVPELKSLSATRFQAYLECPRKFYLNSIEKVQLFPKFNSAVLPVDLGRIEHSIIEEYFKIKKEWDASLYEKIVKTELDIFFKEKEVDEQDKLACNIEVFEYAKNGLFFLFELIKKEPTINFIFEESFSKKAALEFIGRADCIGLTANKIFIIDFKRSSGSIPNKKNILEFEKIQTWFYLNAINENYNKTDIYVGYICLADLSDSIFITNTDDKKYFDNVKYYYPIKNFDELFDQYKKFEEEKVSELIADQTFKINPRDSKSCQYCDYSNICDKGVS